MSQKGEKYARRMERRVDKLEQDVAAITTEQTTQGVRISAVEDDLAVYRAAVSARELKQAAAEIKAAKERRTARAAERERKARRRNKVLAFIALALFVAVCVVMVAKAYSEEPAAEPAAPEVSAAILPAELLFTAAAEEEYMEDPQETEKIEEALLAQGYFSLAVPMPYEWQDYMRTYCEEYGCPYPLALAVAQTESNFDMDAVGASGEVGIMQLNPGPGSSYHAEIQAATGLDPTTASGNIAGGCYKLGLYLDKYGSVEKAAMAYNMGEGGARSAWDSGITSTDYSKAVKEAMETWECTVNAWGRGVTREAARKYETSVTERARRERWQASGCARVVSRKYGTVVVPHGSNFAALLNAAEVWGCDWTEIRDAEVWRADKEERPVPMPHLI